MKAGGLGVQTQLQLHSVHSEFEAILGYSKTLSQEKTRNKERPLLINREYLITDEFNTLKVSLCLF